MNFEEKYNLKLQVGKDFYIQENHRIPQKMNAEFFVFGKTMYCKGNFEKLPTHEYLHVAQFRKYGVVLVVLHYLFYLSFNMLRHGDFKKAFELVPFEVEARAFEKYYEENNLTL